MAKNENGLQKTLSDLPETTERARGRRGARALLSRVLD